jgi:hypothetical protein
MNMVAPVLHARSATFMQVKPARFGRSRHRQHPA